MLSRLQQMLHDAFIPGDALQPMSDIPVPYLTTTSCRQRGPKAGKAKGATKARSLPNNLPGLLLNLATTWQCTKVDYSLTYSPPGNKICIMLAKANRPSSNAGPTLQLPVSRTL